MRPAGRLRLLSHSLLLFALLLRAIELLARCCRLGHGGRGPRGRENYYYYTASGFIYVFFATSKPHRTQFQMRPTSISLESPG